MMWFLSEQVSSWYQRPAFAIVNGLLGISVGCVFYVLSVVLIRKLGIIAWAMPPGEEGDADTSSAGGDSDPRVEPGDDLSGSDVDAAGDDLTGSGTGDTQSSSDTIAG